MTKRTISRTSVVAVALCVMANGATGWAASSKRSETQEYTMANGMIAGNSEAHWTVGTAYATFTARRGERSVVFSITDSTSPDVRGHIHTDRDRDGDIEHVGDFCGRSKPIPVEPGQRIEVGVIVGECPGGGVSVVTQGEIAATFSS